MGQHKSICLALGMGAIGRAVSGYAMTKAGIHVIFADIIDEQIREVNDRGGYYLGTADIYEKTKTVEWIGNVEAVNVNTAAADLAASKAEYIISAVGPKGFSVLLPKITQWLRNRARFVTPAPLYIMLFENDSTALGRMQEAAEKTFGTIPGWLHIGKCSIERMTKVINDPEYGVMAIGETFLPVIAGKNEMAGCSIEDNKSVLQLVDDVQKYYYRKIFLNNLGHAVLSYHGYHRGYTTTLEAMADGEILEILKKTLAESGAALCKHFGFSSGEIKKHNETLMLRFGNPELVDDLIRLGREPLRKISPEERIVYPLRLTYRYGLSEREGLLTTLADAIRYENTAAPGVVELIQMRHEKGDEGILRDVCGADGAFLEDALAVLQRYRT